VLVNSIGAIFKSHFLVHECALAVTPHMNTLNTRGMCKRWNGEVMSVCLQQLNKQSCAMQ
jgi:hypothetical protein